MNIQETIANQSKICSNVCRQIVFALAAISWGLIFIDNKIVCANVIPIITLVIIVIYLTLDVTQYLYSYIKIRKVSSLLLKSEYQPDYTDEQKYTILAKSINDNINIERITYVLFVTKICFLPLILLSLVVHFILMLL